MRRLPHVVDHDQAVLVLELQRQFAGCIFGVDKTWALAGLQDPVQSLSTARFRFPWIWDGKPAVLQSRCTDETGYIQPTLKQLVDIRGANGKFGSFYHLNAIFSWGIAEDGSVSNVQV